MRKLLSAGTIAGMLMMPEARAQDAPSKWWEMKLHDPWLATYFEKANTYCAALNYDSDDGQVHFHSPLDVYKHTQDHAPYLDRAHERYGVLT